MGVGNLTWTLMKFINSHSCDLDSIKSELLAESFIKLNVALSVMHECFEPLKEPSSSRDLMEDVIFSRWSEILIIQNMVMMVYYNTSYILFVLLAGTC